MSPYEIDVLLHYYAHLDDHPDAQRKPPIWGLTIDGFLADGLLRLRGQNEFRDGTYVLGSRGRAFCEALQRVSIPVLCWVMPEAMDSRFTPVVDDQAICSAVEGSK